MLNILEKYLISRLKFIRQIAEFKEEEEIVDIHKQLTDYDISANTARKLKKILQKWLTLLTHIS